MCPQCLRGEKEETSGKVQIKFLKKIISISLAVLLIWITLTSIFVYKNKQQQIDVILVLSGDYDRIHHAVKIAKINIATQIWISGTESDLSELDEIIKKQGLKKERFIVKLCATDTVTNFTCTVRQIAAYGYKHVLLITSDYHMARAMAVGTIVLGSQRIAITPEKVNSHSQIKESVWRKIRDIFRSVIWLVTGFTGFSKVI